MANTEIIAWNKMRDWSLQHAICRIQLKNSSKFLMLKTDLSSITPCVFIYAGNWYYGVVLSDFDVYTIVWPLCSYHLYYEIEISILASFLSPMLAGIFANTLCHYFDRGAMGLAGL